MLPGMTHWQHPNFFAYFPANTSPPSVLAEMLTATLGAQCMLWQTSPAATELETRTLDWLRQMIGLPGGFVGVIQDFGLERDLVRAPGRARAGDRLAGQCGGPRRLPAARVLCLRGGPLSIEKAIRIAGLGRSSLRPLPTDANFAHAARGARRRDPRGPRGRTRARRRGRDARLDGVGAIDPVRPIGELCREHGLYLHVDAAWAGNALLLEEQRWMLDGAEHVDSLVFNPHKWLLTNFDCSAHFVRDPDALVRTLAILPEYLKSREAAR